MLPRIMLLHAAIKSVDAPLKLVITGNHDLTLDVPTFQRKLAEAQLEGDEDVKREYGDYGEARRLIDAMPGITFLDERTYELTLANGAHLRVFASPCTPSRGVNAFQYLAGSRHAFNIDEANANVVITNGPPLGVLDRTENGERVGCAGLFSASWGAKLVAWRKDADWSGWTEALHLTHIDDEHSEVLRSLKCLLPGRAAAYEEMGYAETSHCHDDSKPLMRGQETLFVNAAFQGLTEELPVQVPWMVDIDLPAANYRVDEWKKLPARLQ
ncbi:Metallo-dependent phosphatase-like protein [Xylariomycetidae sp. FL0641]|nr:Metallo-dependent phosphatase-like protein [Xylariomycetidae sp. FL0641]